MTDHTAPYTIHALELGHMGNFIYVIHDHASDRAAVVDPAWDVPAILDLVARRGLRITDILLTHSHFDHINGVEALLNASDAQLHYFAQTRSGVLGSLSRFAHPARRRRPHPLGRNRDRSAAYARSHARLGLLSVGRSNIDWRYLVRVRLRALRSARRRPRADVPTLRRLGERLPDHTLIRPGHNYGITPTSTMAEQLAGNPFLHFDNRAGFVDYRMHLHDREEPYRPETRPHSH